jgi:hypothetical protein
VVVDGWIGDDAGWFYTDERATLDHFVERCWFSKKLAGQMASTVPDLSQ